MQDGHRFGKLPADLPIWLSRTTIGGAWAARRTRR